MSTEAICRRVYPQATTVEKKHRVAVLHRLIGNPPRPFEDRFWTVAPTERRGYWRWIFIEGTKGPDPRADTAYHEAGHALADLYWGHPIERVVVHTDDEISRQRDEAIKRSDGITYALLYGYVLSPQAWWEDFSSVEEAAKTDPPRARRALIGLLSGPIAEAHYRGNWPLRHRGISNTYDVYYSKEGVPTPDLEKVNAILAALSDDPQERATIFRRTQDLAQGLIRSQPGWQFIKALATEMLDLKHGSLGHRRTAAIFRKAFGRPPPARDDWHRHWPPTLPQVRTGWLPPEAG